MLAPAEAVNPTDPVVVLAADGSAGDASDSIVQAAGAPQGIRSTLLVFDDAAFPPMAGLR